MNTFTMVSELLVFLLFPKLFAFTYLERDDFSSLDLLNVSHSIFVGEDQSHEIKLDQYLNFTELISLINELENYEVDYYPRYGQYHEKIVKSSVIGKSAVTKAPIHAVRIGNFGGGTREILKPMFKFVANIHGDDVVGYALMVSLMKYLVYSYGHDERVTELLESVDIWIVPTLNPDGLFKSKFNGNGIDLDADFLDKLNEDDGDRQAETKSMLKFIKENPFVLSGNLQSGAIVAENDRGAVAQDDDIFVKLASDYAQRNPMMAAGKACNESFNNGIANGKMWKTKRGGMQGANYIFSNCFEITLYLGCCKYPAPEDLPKYWTANLESMLKFMESTRQGIYGFVKDDMNRMVDDAVIKVKGRDKEIKVTANGEYWRLLVPGDYAIRVSAPGCNNKTEILHLTRLNPYFQYNFRLTRYTGVRGNIFFEFNHKRIKEGTIEVLKQNILVATVPVNTNSQYWIPLKIGLYTLIAKGTGYLANRKTVNVIEEVEVRLNFTLTHPRVRVIVVDVAGKPVKKTSITVRYDNRTDVYELTRKDNGEVYLRLDVENCFHVTARAFGYKEETKMLNLTENQTYVELTFVLKPKFQKLLPCLNTF